MLQASTFRDQLVVEGILVFLCQATSQSKANMELKWEKQESITS